MLCRNLWRMQPASPSASRLPQDEHFFAQKRLGFFPTRPRCAELPGNVKSRGGLERIQDVFIPFDFLLWKLCQVKIGARRTV